MPSAEIITIGTELLLGEITDTNAPYLARCLRDAGIDLFRKTTVGDNVKRIAGVIQQALERCDILITTGGLGPTVDDPTRDAIALALGVNTEFQPELWEQIKVRFQRFGRIPTENNRRQAYIPSGARAVENPVGTAPIFILEHGPKAIISLPGVPREMEYLMEHVIIPYLRQRYDLHGIIKARIIHTVGIGESQIDDMIGDLEILINPTVGLAAHSGQVDIRITAKAGSLSEAETLIGPVEKTVYNRLGEFIYGVDHISLEEIALRSVSNKNWSIAILEAGLGGRLVRRLAKFQGPLKGGQVLNDPLSPIELMPMTDNYRQFVNADVGLGVALNQEGDRFETEIVLINPQEKQHFTRLFGGPPEYASIWAINQTLDIIRRI